MRYRNVWWDFSYSITFLSIFIYDLKNFPFRSEKRKILMSCIIWFVTFHSEKIKILNFNFFLSWDISLQKYLFPPRSSINWINSQWEQKFLSKNNIIIIKAKTTRVCVYFWGISCYFKNFSVSFSPIMLSVIALILLLLSLAFFVSWLWIYFKIQYIMNE